MASDPATPHPDEIPTVGPTRDLPAESSDPDATRLTRHTPEGTWDAAPRDGAVFGRYRIIGELGRGGQAVVHLAEDTHLGRRVALKVISGQAMNTAALIRFEREARVTSKLDHPGICPVYDIGTHAGVSYIAMRYIDGIPLSTLIARSRVAADTVPSSFFAPEDEPESPAETAPTSGRRLSRGDVAEVVRLGAALARALHAAHEAGVVHRDLKPGNIMVTDEREPVILDFGLASDADEVAETLTQSGDVFGTPAYMSPEQVRGEKLDLRTDVWSLGVTLWEMLAGVRPFAGPTREALYEAIRRSDAPRLRTLNSAVGRDLETVIETALEKDLSRRYATAADLEDDLERALRGEPVAARRVGPVGRALRWARRRKAVAAVVVLIVTGLPVVGVLGAQFVQSREAVRKQKETETRVEVERLVNQGFINATPEYGSARVAEAYEAFDRALRLDPDNETAAGGLLFSLIHLDREDEVAREIEGRLARFRDRMVFALVTARAEGKSAISTPEVLDSEDLDAVSMFLLGRIMNSEGDVTGNVEASDTAYTLLSRAVQATDRPRLMYHAELALAAFATGRTRELRGIATAMTKLWPEEPDGWFNLGLSWMDDDPDRALAAFERTARMAPHLAGTFQTMSIVHRRAGRLERALECSRRAVELVPDSSANQLAHANALAALGRFDEAEAAARASLALRSPNPRALTALTLVLESAGRLEDADEDVAEALAAHPDDPQVLNVAGNHFSRRGEWARAAEHLERASVLLPNDAGIARNLGVTKIRIGDYEGAANAFARAARLAPDDLESLGSQAAMLSELFRHEEGLAILRPAMKDHPAAPSLPALLGQILMATGEYRQAIACFERARELGHDGEWLPGAIETAGAFGPAELLIERMDRGEDVEFPAEHAELIDLAEVLARRGRFEAAAGIYLPMWESLTELDEFSRPRLLAGGVFANLGLGASGLLDADELREWREKALDLVDADLAFYEARADDRGERTSIRHTIHYWRSEQFARLRDPRALAGATSDELRAWRAIFARVDALAARVMPRPND